MVNILQSASGFLVNTVARLYMTKPLHGAKLNGFCQQTMHLPVAAQLIMATVLN